MRLPRKAILIRLCIYIPVLGYFGWRAFDHWRSKNDTTVDAASELDRKLAPHKRMITLPDGTQQEVVELTPEQAEAILGQPLPELDGPKANLDDPVSPEKATR